MEKINRYSFAQTKTYRYLEDALLVLMEATKYEKITVHELTEKAGISRTSFYAQFTCKQDFVAHVIEYTNRGATAISMDYGNIDHFSEKNFVGYYTRLYQYIAGKHRIYRTMLGENGLPEFREGMRAEAETVWRTELFPRRDASAITAAEIDHDVVLAYIVSAHIGLVEYWLKSDMREPAVSMAQHLFRMTCSVLQSSGICPKL